MYRRILLSTAALAVSLCCVTRPLPAAAGATTPDADARARFERLSQDPLLDRWQREFFAHRLQQVTSGASTNASRAPVAAPLAASASVPYWSELVPMPQLAGVVPVYDPVGDRILVAGGQSAEGLTNDVWAMSLSPPRVWSRLPVGGAGVAPRLGYSLILDSQHHRLVLFGGQDSDGAYLDDLWMLPLDGPLEWQRIDALGTRPGARTNHSAVYDEAGHRMIVFGGTNGSFAPLDETWALSLDDTMAWTAMVVPGTPPTGRSGHVAVMDDVNHRMVVCAGSIGGNNYEYESYVWTLSLGASPIWTRYGPYYGSGTIGTGLRGVYDAGHDALAIVPAGTYNTGLLRFTFGGSPGWSQLTIPANPSDIQYAYGVVLEPGRARALVVCGHTASSTEYRSDVVGLNLSTYGDWADYFRPPLPRSSHAAAYDPLRHRMLVFGGSVRSTSNVTNEVWALSVEDPPQWTQLLPTGVLPIPRQEASMIYDAARDRMIVFGGYNNGQTTNEVWALSLASSPPVWSRVYPIGSLPLERSQHAAAYDPIRHRMVVFAGQSNNNLLSDAWALSLNDPPTWTALHPVGTAPTPRRGSEMVYDDVGDRMLVVGGNEAYYYPSISASEVWSLGLEAVPAWSQVHSLPFPIAMAGECLAVPDPAGHRVLRLGYSGNYGNDSLYVDAFTPTGDSVWSTVPTAGDRPKAYAGASAVYDSDHNRVIYYGGYPTYSGYELNPVTYALSLGAPPLGVPGHDGRGDPGVALAAYPNPGRGRLRLRLVTPAAGPARLDVVDVAGRALWTRDFGTLPEGEHDLDLGAGPRLAPGLYFVTYVGSGTRVSVRTVVVR